MNCLRLFGLCALCICVSSCEIDDDFGKSQLTDNRGELITNVQYGVNSLIWANESTVLFRSYDGIQKLNLQTKSVSSFFKGNIAKLLGVTDNNKVLIILYDDSGGQRTIYSLVAVDLATLEFKEISADIVFDYYQYQINSTLSGNTVTYAEVTNSESPFHGDVYIHNIETNARVLAVSYGRPLALSPDGKRVLYESVTQGYYSYFTYDTQSKNAESVNITDPYAMLKICWTKNGILTFHQNSNNQNSSLHRIEVRNVTTPQSSFSKESAVPGVYSVFVSQDGSKFTYVSAGCASPYYTKHCYDLPLRITLQVVDYATKEDRPVISIIQKQDENDQVVDFESVAFSPDNQKLIYSQQGKIFVSDIN